MRHEPLDVDRLLDELASGELDLALVTTSDAAADPLVAVPGDEASTPEGADRGPTDARAAEDAAAIAAACVLVGLGQAAAQPTLPSDPVPPSSRSESTVYSPSTTISAG